MFTDRIINRLRSTSFRTFVLYPVVVLILEWIWNRGWIQVDPWFLPLLVWGYLQYRLIGANRIRLGGGGPGMNTPPDRLVTGGPYAYRRNPMHLGHIICLIGLALSLRSWPGFADRHRDNRLVSWAAYCGMKNA